jgi:hypothetical protein
LKIGPISTKYLCSKFEEALSNQTIFPNTFSITISYLKSLNHRSPNSNFYTKVVSKLDNYKSGEENKPVLSLLYYLTSIHYDNERSFEQLVNRLSFKKLSNKNKILLITFLTRMDYMETSWGRNALDKIINKNLLDNIISLAASKSTRSKILIDLENYCQKLDKSYSFFSQTPFVQLIQKEEFNHYKSESRIDILMMKLNYSKISLNAPYKKMFLNKLKKMNKDIRKNNKYIIEFFKLIDDKCTVLPKNIACDILLNNNKTGIILIDESLKTTYTQSYCSSLKYISEKLLENHNVKTTFVNIDLFNSFLKSKDMDGLLLYLKSINIPNIYRTYRMNLYFSELNIEK